MKILDEELTKKITYSSGCKETLKKYRTTLLYQILAYSFFVLVALLIMIFILLKYKKIEGFVFQIFGLFFLGFWISIYKLSNLFSDIRINKLDIRKDKFLGLSYEQGSYIAKFHEEGSLKISAPDLFGLEINKEVFIIRTSVSKTILDIVPADSF